MDDQASELIDIAYELSGGMLPGRYAFALWDGLVRALPWLATEEEAGVLPLRGTVSGEQMVLARRAKLVLRLPAGKERQALQLAGQTLDIGGYALAVGAAQSKPLRAHPSLHAHLVVGADDEAEFLAQVERQLGKLGIPCKWICGKRTALQDGPRRITGYSLVVYELSPADSLRLQQWGLGEERRYGCGLFVPCKDIPDFK